MTATAPPQGARVVSSQRFEESREQILRAAFADGGLGEVGGERGGQRRRRAGRPGRLGSARGEGDVEQGREGRAMLRPLHEHGRESRLELGAAP